MQKEQIIEKLKDKGCRITKQRLILLDIILENDFACCKEIYYRAVKVDKNIGSATVYRMMNILEEIGAVNRGGMVRLMDGENSRTFHSCVIHMESGEKCTLTGNQWNDVVRAGLEACGYTSGQLIKSVRVVGRPAG